MVYDKLQVCVYAGGSSTRLFEKTETGQTSRAPLSACCKVVKCGLLLPAASFIGRMDKSVEACRIGHGLWHNKVGVSWNWKNLRPVGGRKVTHID